MQRLKVAIVGCGWVAGTQISTGFGPLPNLFEVVACCDTNTATLADFADRYRIPGRTAAFEEILAMPDIDVVSICTPPMLHHAMAVAALGANKNVICEKPFTSSLALLDSVVVAERASRGRIMPIFQYRFGPGAWKVHHLIRSGLAGKAYVSSAETAWRRGPDYYQVPWRGKLATELGGVLLTQAIHIHDLLLWLMGPVAAVNCFTATRVNPIEVEDCAVASLLMADGSLASLTATLGSLRPVTRIRLCCEDITFERQCFDDQASKPGEDPWAITPRTAAVGSAITHALENVPPILSGFAGQFALFHEALSDGGVFPVKLDDARRSLELITALFHAADTGRAVHLPIGPDHAGYAGWR
jgi:predicted dehydrogenase